MPEKSRVLALALPYLLLCKQTRLPVSLALGAYNFYQQKSEQRWVELAYTGAWMGLSCVVPNVATVATAAANIVTDYQKDDCPRFVRSVIDALAIWMGTREWIFAAALAEMAIDGRDAKREFSKGKWLEGVAKLGLVAVRGYGIAPEAVQLKKRWMERRISQWELNGLERNVDLAVYLNQQGYSNHIEGIKIYSWRGSLGDVTLENCDLSGGDFRNSVWERVSIVNSDLRCAVFDEATFRDVTIENSRLTGAVFFDAKVIRSVIARCDLENVLLMNAASLFSYEECTANRITKPVLGMGWNFWGVGAHTELQKEAFQEKDALLYFVETESTAMDWRGIDAQVDDLMKGVREDIPRQVLVGAVDGPVADIRERMGRLAPYLDGVFLPGNGDDIEPEWYGAARRWETHAPSSKAPNVIRFALLEAAEKLKIPAWGVCHGNQMINVWRGGTLQQHVPGQYGGRPLEVLPGLSPLVDGIAREIVGPEVYGYSCHHQAVGKVGRGLEVFLEVNERGFRIPKAILSEDGLMMGTQIHPEVYVDGSGSPAEQRNLNFFSYFLQLAKKKLATKVAALQAGSAQAQVQS
jgi:gamma-glutamyl-gamma-aminobutyrate hydrolase PuuD